jgi:hypothetical protein
MQHQLFQQINNKQSYIIMERKLSDLTIVELKSLAYDELARLESAQSNLRILNQEIANRVQQTQQAQQSQQGTLTPTFEADPNAAGSASL